MLLLCSVQHTERSPLVITQDLQSAALLFFVTHKGPTTCNKPMGHRKAGDLSLSELHFHAGRATVTNFHWESLALSGTVCNCQQASAFADTVLQGHTHLWSTASSNASIQQMHSPLAAVQVPMP